jgi:hypothetical protein
MGLLTPGWLKKALKLRTIVSCIPDNEIKESPVETDLNDAMRAFRRGTIDEQALLDRYKALGDTPPPERLHEPAEIYGWRFRATLVRYHGKPWWLVSVERPSGTASAKDKAMLVKIMGALGCDDIERDQLSVMPMDELVAAKVPVMYLWPNMIQLLDVHIHTEKANKGKLHKDAMRLVPRGSRPTDGYEDLETAKPSGPT